MEDDSYYSERELGAIPRDQTEIEASFWGGFIAFIKKLVSDGSLAESFPELCFENPVIVGCNAHSLGLAFSAEVPSIDWPLNHRKVPKTLDILDAVEFFSQHVSKPVEKEFHQFARHFHLFTFNFETGCCEYRDRINRLFRRNGLSYKLTKDGKVIRIGPPVLKDVLERAEFCTEDKTLNALLEAAREKFADPNPDIRRDALEKLWDAWERLKTLESGDKKTSAQKILQSAVSEPTLLDKISAEARELTKIGNEFRIRHSETDKVEITEAEHIDYLFHRLFALVWMILKKTGHAS